MELRLRLFKQKEEKTLIKKSKAINSLFIDCYTQAKQSDKIISIEQNEKIKCKWIQMEKNAD